MPDLQNEQLKPAKTNSLLTKARRVAARGLLGSLVLTGGAATATDLYLAPVNISVEDSVVKLVQHDFDPKSTYLDIISDSTLPPIRRAFLTHYLDVLDDIADTEGKQSVVDKLKRGVLPNPIEMFTSMRDDNTTFSEKYKKYDPLLATFDYTNTETFTLDVLKAKPASQPVETQAPDFGHIEETHFTPEEKARFIKIVGSFAPALQNEVVRFISGPGDSYVTRYENGKPQAPIYYQAEQIERVLDFALSLSPETQRQFLESLTFGYIPKPEDIDAVLPVYGEYFKYIYPANEEIRIEGLSEKTQRELTSQVLDQMGSLMSFPQYSGFKGSLTLVQMEPLLTFCESITGNRLTAANVALKVMLDTSGLERQQELLQSLQNPEGIRQYLETHHYSDFALGKISPDELIVLLRSHTPLTNDTLSRTLENVRLLNELQLTELFNSEVLSSVISSNGDNRVLTIMQKIKSIVGDDFVPSQGTDSYFNTLIRRAIDASSVNLMTLQDFEDAEVSITQTGLGRIMIPTSTKVSLVGYDENVGEKQGIVAPLILSSNTDDFAAVDESHAFLTEDLKSSPIEETLKRLQDYDYIWSDEKGLHFGKPSFLREIQAADTEDLVRQIRAHTKLFSRVLPVSRNDLLRKDSESHLAYLEGSRWVGQFVVTDNEEGAEHKVFETSAFIVAEGESIGLPEFDDMSKALKLEDDEAAYILVPDAGLATTVKTPSATLSVSPGNNAFTSVLFEFAQ